MMVFVLFVHTLNAWSFSYDLSWYNHPIRENFYEIKNPAQYEGLIQLVNVESKSFINDTISIVSDMSLSGLGSLTNFDGIILGNNHTISNLKSPLVSTLSETGVIESLIFDNTCSVSNGTDAGMVSRVCYGVIKDCTNFGEISRSDIDHIKVGGICGNLQNGKILGCINRGKITATVTRANQVVVRAGGVCAYMESKATIMGCQNYGTVTASAYAYSIAGGIIGDCQSVSIVENCINNGTVMSILTGTSSLTSSQIIQYTGGIGGQAQEGATINQCSNYGSISNNTQYVSGIIGHAGKTSIFNCENHGSVTSTSGYFFSCASGICSYYDAVSLDNNKYFLNCVNTGAISSSAKNAIATAAGICNDIKYGNVGNLISTGSVSSSAYGTSSHSFQISQYETTNCEIMSDATNVEAANTYVNSAYAGSTPLANWGEENGSIKLLFLDSYYILAYQGLATICCVSENTNVEHTIKYFEEGEEHTKTFTSSIVIANLSPNTEYKYTLSEKSTSLQTKGTFKTLPIGMNLKVDSVKYTTANVTLYLNAKGVNINEYGAKYRLTEEEDWIYQRIDGGWAKLKSLHDNEKYDIRPYVIYQDNEIEGDYASFETFELVPSIENTDITSSTLSFRTLNMEDLVSFKYGLICGDREFMANADGTILIDSLTYFGTHTVSSFIDKYGERKTYNVGSFKMISFETHPPVQLSPNAAMVRILANAGYYKNYTFYDLYKFSNPYIQYRKLMESEENSSIEVTPIKTDDYYEYCITIKFQEDTPYQYRMKVTNDTKKYTEYYETFADWVLVNPADATVDIVKPIFTNIKASIKSAEIIVSCCNVDGEENVSEKGIEYKVSGSTNYNSIKLKDINGLLSRSFTSLVPNIEYIGRFYNKVKDKTYYSKVFSFNSDGLLQIIGEDSVTGIESVRTEDRGVSVNGLYDQQGRKLNSMIRGINIIRFSDGTSKKVIAK